MIDMHSHILFGVDDGAVTIQDSVELIRREIDNGVNSIILTPHFNKHIAEVNADKILQNYGALKKIAENENINIQLYLGNEIYFGSDFYEVLEKSEFITLAGSKYILIEFNYIDSPSNIAEMCYEARIMGYKTIIAHAEKYKSLHDDMQLLESVLAEGALLQINASSVLNKEYKEYYKFANELLNRRLVSFVASDVHDLINRGVHLDEAYDVVKKKHGDSYADKIFNLNQLNILSDEYIEVPSLAPARRGLLSNLFNKLRFNKLPDK